MLSIPVLFAIFIGGATASGNWGYGATSSGVYGPADWGHLSPFCDANAQSPVNINTNNVVENDDDDDDGKKLIVEFLGSTVGTFKNNGHSPTLTVERGGATLVNPINGKNYKLAQFHFHFGCDDSRGSEHTVNGQSYPGELHLVFYNTAYGNIGNAATKSDGLTVIGVFLRKASTANVQLKNLANKLAKIKEEGSQETNVGVDLSLLVPGLSLGSRDYYSYKGSLTTPGCYESVSWLVVKNPISADSAVLGAFRQLQAQHGKSHGLMCDNYRPTQPLYGRPVTLNEADD